MLQELREFLAAPASRIAATYRVSAGRLEVGHWTHDLTDGGGRVLGEVCHFIDSLRFLTGASVESSMRRVRRIGVAHPGA